MSDTFFPNATSIVGKNRIAPIEESLKRQRGQTFPTKNNFPHPEGARTESINTKEHMPKVVGRHES